MADPVVTLQAACERQLVAVEVSSQRTVEWAIAAAAASRPDRAPVNLALVIDRSGSMQGDKLRFVQQAAAHALDLLDDRDRVALVVYDDQVDLLAASAPVTPQRRQQLKEQIAAIRPGGLTDLGGGWLEGCRAIADQPSSAITRALLLTDGLANRGITDGEELTHHARELRMRGVSTSTLGVGLDFNEHLLEALAEQGGGRFYYIERPQQIPEVFRSELGALLTVVAHEAFLRIPLPRGVAVELIGDLPHERDHQQLRVFLGDICAGEERRIYTGVLTPPDLPGTSVVLRGELSYASPEGLAGLVATELAFSYVREAEVLLAPFYEEILQRSSEVELASAAQQALRLERAGAREQAQATLQRALAVSAAYAPAYVAAAYEQFAAQVGQGLSEADRKQQHFAAYKARYSR